MSLQGKKCPICDGVLENKGAYLLLKTHATSLKPEIIFKSLFEYTSPVHAYTCSDKSCGFVALGAS
jgi:hypothetical protein